MDTSKFYDEISEFYSLLYPSWEKSIERQARQLDLIFRNHCTEEPETVLDVSCGIGTQTLGLAERGYMLVASDISKREINKARAEASKRNLQIEFSVCDMRKAYDHHRKEFDVVLSADNSVPHLLSDEEIVVAFKQFYKCTRDGGICVITVRDYEKESLTSGVIRPYAVQEKSDGRYLMFQVWNVEQDIYETSMYLVKDLENGECEAKVSRTKYYAIPIPRLVTLLKQVGFVNVVRLEEGFFQPVLIGIK
jgi:SAM-dependent methyltransferase